MATTGNLSEEQVHCSICLDVFTNPVSIPCGHNFCQSCILGYWKTSPLYQCPMCKKSFHKRPDISINTVLREIAEQFKEIRVRSAEGTEVLCDVCLGNGRPKAVKSCLVCLTSYCEEHLKSHSARFTKHKLIEPVANMEDRMCPKHERLLELFCKKDQTCVCVLCTETDHRAHYTVPVEREWTDKKAQLKRTEIDVQQMIQDRVKKVEEIKQCVELNKASAQREVEESVQVFSELVRSIQRTQAELVLSIEEKQRQTERWAEGFIAELDREIAELKRRNTDLENMARTDHIHFLKNFPALSTPPSVKDWSGTSVPTDTCVGMIRRSISKLEASLNEMVGKLAESEIKKVLKYAVDVTLDPDSANPWLQLSQDRRQVRHLGAWQDLPDNPDRFDTVVIVLGREGFTSGRHYWEVQVGDKDDWYLGVARSSVNRKGRISVSTSQGYWALAMKKGQGYRVSTSPPILLPLNPKPKQVGVYVDYEEGQVSFYDVRARTHIYTFKDTFMEKILPFFYLYCCDKASDTIVICPVNEKSLIKADVYRIVCCNIITVCGLARDTRFRCLEFTEELQRVRDSIMSSFSILASLPEDHFQCSICLNIFNDPVTTPCGHNFCKTCLSGHWDRSDLCHCPMCNKRFHVRPEISTNVVIEEISVQIKKRKVDKPESADAPWQVTCDVCTDAKCKALKSCLVCLTSYCEAHLEPHQRVPSLMRHKLMDPVENLEERMCEKHERILELFCRDEQVCICLLCSETDHMCHETVPVEEEGAQQKENIDSKKAEIKIMIEERMEKIKEFTESSEISQEKTKKEIDESDKLFNTLMNHVQVTHTKLKSNIEEKLRKSQDKDEAMIEELQEEITQLQSKYSELEELSQSDDYLHLLLTLQALGNVSATKNWSKIRVYSDLCLQTVRRAMTHLVDTFQSELKTLTETELTRMRQYKASVTFDAATAGCCLVVSEFGKRLKYCRTASPSSSDDLERFDCPMILGTTGFISGRHYWEVQVGLRTDWDVGVAKETVPRTGKIPLKRENGFFAIGKRGLDYQVHCTRDTALHLCPRPRKVGVYVDYMEGRVSFYDVDRKLHIHSFTRESFKEKLFPYFYLYGRYKKSEPLIITSMEHQVSVFSLWSSLQQAKNNSTV
ncbi:uncharacterized protein LOC123979862 [Micropterus dolomieu]|uniref:uncharacterized protein LOC123979862 n=1 Tax=Micropterus dolomieu TaxID=147949 RepID=UPI001E8D89FD|nr:uncharacterized protein LOC123979862 [Micropterus dolomieu]